MPLLIPLPTDRLTASITSLVPSTTDLETYGDVEKGRVRSNGSALVGRVLRSDMVILVIVVMYVIWWKDEVLNVGEGKENSPVDLVNRARDVMFVT